MEPLQRFFLFVSIACLACLFAGLLKPWIMVWWEDTQNRKKVIKVYGLPAVISYTLYWIIFFIGK